MEEEEREAEEGLRRPVSAGNPRTGKSSSLEMKGLRNI